MDLDINNDAKFVATKGILKGHLGKRGNEHRQECPNACLVQNIKEVETTSKVQMPKERSS